MVSTVSGSLTPVVPSVALPAAGQPAQTVAPDAKSPTSSADQLSSSQLQSGLDDTLKSSGFRGEVDTTDPNQVVVRIVDDVTGRTVIQIPTATAMAIAEAIRKGTLNEGQTSAGNLLDEAA